MVEEYYTANDFRLQAAKELLLPMCMIWQMGWIYGLVTYYILSRVYYFCLSRLCKMHYLTALDEFFLLDNAKNRANILTVMKLDRIKDVEKIRKRIIELQLVHPRLRSELVKFGGEYFFKEIPH